MYRQELENGLEAQAEADEREEQYRQELSSWAMRYLPTKLREMMQASVGTGSQIEELDTEALPF